MKFGKEFKKQKVAEWIEAYMDYNKLKTILREIRETKHYKSNPKLNKTLSQLNSRSTTTTRIDSQELGIITEGSRKIFDPKSLKICDEEEISFFEKLDEELEKVCGFYRGKVEEIVDEANGLNKQIEALVALRIKLGKSDNFDECGDSLRVLENLEMNSSIQSPISAIRGVFGVSDLSFDKENLKRAEEQLRVAFVEFYHKLGLLKHYSFMNLSAFSKIMKKYDKITSRRVSRLYMEVVDNSYLGNSDEIIDMLERVESTFAKNFSDSNRREGMKSLRPKLRKEKHRITFSSGFLSGFAIALLVAIVLRIESQKLMNAREGTQYIQSIFPLYSIFLYVVLHMLMYAIDIYLWRRYMINYSFIFGFKRGTELGYRRVFLLSTGLAVMALSGFLANLHLDMNSDTQEFKKLTELVPLALVTLSLMILFCPLNVLYRSSRFFFIRCLFRCILAPLYPVTFPEFFLADQLTSQMQGFRSSVLYVCYYGLGEYSRRQNKCHKHGVYNTLYFVIAVIPYWLRFLQCLRRLLEDRDAMHGYNALTYLSTIVAVVVRTAYELKKGTTWMAFALISSAIATIGNIYWDIAHDWGLLRRHSKNPYLRDRLLISHKTVYIVAMISDVILRLAWMQLVLAFNLHSVHKMSITTTVFCLEIVRRGIWNFFRLENEHLNNVGKYRAFRSVPLPFRRSDHEAVIDKDDG